VKSVRCKSQDITMRWSQVRASEFHKHVLYIDKINKTWFASEKVYWHQPSAPKFSKTLVLKVFCRWREGGSGAAPTWVARLFPTLQGFQTKSKGTASYIYYNIHIIYIYAYVHAKLCIHIMYVYVNTYIHTYMYVCMYIYLHTYIVCQKQHVLNSFFFMSCTYANSAANI
jgi:hypothetical protein